MNTKTFREIAAAWKEYKRPYVKQSTMAAYVLILENHILPYFGDGGKRIERQDSQGYSDSHENGDEVRGQK